MKNIILRLTVLFLVSSLGAAVSLFESCGTPDDCAPPLACRDNICVEDCYSHDECRFDDMFCGPDNICTPKHYGPCYPSTVCPECECSQRICPMSDIYFEDNLDNGQPYCTSEWNCIYKGETIGPAFYYHIPGEQNVFRCEVTHWGPPVCVEGLVWNPEVDVPYGIDNPEELPDGCIPATVPVPEFASTAVALVSLIGAISIAILAGKK